MTFIRRLEEDVDYAEKVIGICKLDTKVLSGIKLRVNLLVKNKKVQSITYVIYYEKLMEGDIGPFASMGSVLWKGKIGDRLFTQGLNQLGFVFDKIETSTLLSLNLDIKENEFSVIGFKADVSIAFMELYKGDYNTLHLDDHVELRDEWAMAVTIAVLPFPLRISYEHEVQVIGVNKYNLKHLAMYNMKFTNNKYHGRGHLADVTARGDSLREAKRRVYRTIENLKIPGLMYRRDIGTDVASTHNKLCKWGWINE